ncbi:hypothetical protein CEXT_438571 [Caerostris extrusa]|uniref:Uncharacterized protein n=1 Tax=Caerostris extrusa TaxID=172846 RepID=A0AAV4U6B0_CAEEX|nr:hypothetical protein CEXT_438571 [Caerostris extrusa]
MRIEFRGSLKLRPTFLRPSKTVNIKPHGRYDLIKLKAGLKHLPRWSSEVKMAVGIGVNVICRFQKKKRVQGRVKFSRQTTGMK